MLIIKNKKNHKKYYWNKGKYNLRINSREWDFWGAKKTIKKLLTY